jgi:hypothetical protein
MVRGAGPLTGTGGGSWSAAAISGDGSGITLPLALAQTVIGEIRRCSTSHDTRLAWPSGGELGRALRYLGPASQVCDRVTRVSFRWCFAEYFVRCSKHRSMSGWAVLRSRRRANRLEARGERAYDVGDLTSASALFAEALEIRQQLDARSESVASSLN